MSRINLDNYEAWFLDFFEGRLDAAQTDEMFQFLERYPKLKAELKNFEIIPLQPEPIDFDEKSILKGEADELLNDKNLQLKPNQNIQFSNKNSLKKPAVCEEDIFALAEGEITGSQAEALKSIIQQDVVLSQELAAFRSARLQPDNTIRYPHKAALKKGTSIIPLFVRYASAAAVLTGIAFAAWWFNQNNDSTPVVVENPTQKTIIGTDVNDAQKNTATLIESENTVSPNNTIKNTLPNAVQNSNLANAQPNSKKVASIVVPDEKPNDLAVDEKPAPLEIIPANPSEEPNFEQKEVPSLELGNEDVADNTPIEKVQPLNNSTPKTTTQPSPAAPNSNISKALGYFAKAASEKITEASGNRVAVQNSTSPEGEYHTSTFRLGSFEVSRGRSAK
jgi:hypothetical protein